MTKRSLYQCLNARCRNGRIVCSAGHALGAASNGNIPLVKLKRGAPLEGSTCQDCPEYDEMGGPVTKTDRGWS